MTTKIKSQICDSVGTSVGQTVAVVPVMKNRPPLPSLRSGVTRVTSVQPPSVPRTVSGKSASQFSHVSDVQDRTVTARRKGSPGVIRQRKPSRTPSVERDEEEDIKFIDVPRNESSLSGLSERANVTTNSIVPEDLLLQSQETDYNKVYEANLHASDVAEIKNLEKLKKLRCLDLSCNRIEKIKNLEQCQELRELKLFDNKIKTVERLERLKELSSLQLQHNRIKSIGKGLSYLKKLKLLRLDSNQILKLEPGEMAGCSQITTLDISCNMLENLSALNSLPNLEELSATNNRLKTVSDLGRCRKLKEVDLSYNRLTDLTGLKNLPHLQTLNVSHNHLNSLKEIGKLKGLQELNISNNRLQSVSVFCDQFPNLEVLNVSENQLKHQSDVLVLKGLAALVELYLSGNPFVKDEGSSAIHTELPSLELLDGITLKKATGKCSVPLMRPMSASAVVSVRYVENQMKTLTDELQSFQTSFSQRFESLKAVYDSLPSEPPEPSVQPTTPATEQRPSTSRCSSRSKIKLAQEFSASQEMGASDVQLPWNEEIFKV